MTKSLKDNSTSPDNLCRLAGIFIMHFGEQVHQLIKVGNIGAHPDMQAAMRRLLQWKSIRDKEYEWDKLTVDERREVLDAVAAEEQDGLSTH